MTSWEKYRSLLGELNAYEVEVKELAEVVESQRATIATRDRAIQRLEAKCRSIAKSRLTRTRQHRSQNSVEVDPLHKSDELQIEIRRINRVTNNERTLRKKAENEVEIAQEKLNFAADETKKMLARMNTLEVRLNTADLREKKAQDQATALERASESANDRRQRMLRGQEELANKLAEAKRTARRALSQIREKNDELEDQDRSIADMRGDLKRLKARCRERGRKQRQNARKVKELQKEIQSLKQKSGREHLQKPFDQLKRRQKTNRCRKVEKILGNQTKQVLDQYHMTDVDHPKLVTIRQEGGVITGVKVREVASREDLVRSHVDLHDSGVSKVKLHEAHMLNPDSVPSRSETNAEEAKLNQYIEDNLDLHVDPNGMFFHVCPKSLLLYVLKKRGLNATNIRNGVVDVITQADGRGTGASFKSIVKEMRIMNEGRAIFKQNRAYLQSYIKGDEDRKHMPELLKWQLERMRKLQETGIDLPVDPADPEGRTVNIKVRWHLLCDAKYSQLTHGLMRFCDEGCNCLKCFAHTKDREDPTRRYYTETERFNNAEHTDGQVANDLYDFIPMERRWTEQLHLTLRFLMDKLIKTGFTEIINKQNRSENEGIKYIENEMKEGLNRSFKFAKAKVKDPTAINGYMMPAVGSDMIIRIASEFDFASGFRKEPERGSFFQKMIRKWVSYYREVQVWPGDGPQVNADNLWKKYSRWARRLTRGGKGIPGRRGYVAAGWPLHTIRTFYGHAWMNHVPEEYVRSRQYAPYFGNAVGLRGGMKVFRTDQLERSNLLFFHQYFQICSRRPKTVLKECGMARLRRMVNKCTIDRSTKECRHCARGYQKGVYLRRHEEICSSNPVKLDVDADESFDTNASYSSGGAMDSESSRVTSESDA